MGSFLHELKRRNVYKVAIGYAAVAWALLQAAALVASMNSEPASLMEILWLVAGIGFIVALIIAWSFEMTPSGMKRTHNISPEERLPYWSRKKFTAFIVTLVLLGFVLLACRYFLLA